MTKTSKSVSNSVPVEVENAVLSAENAIASVWNAADGMTVASLRSVLLGLGERIQDCLDDLGRPDIGCPQSASDARNRHRSQAEKSERS